MEVVVTSKVKDLEDAQHCIKHSIVAQLVDIGAFKPMPFLLSPLSSIANRKPSFLKPSAWALLLVIGAKQKKAVSQLTSISLIYIFNKK